MDLVLRSACDRDLPQIADLYAQVVREDASNYEYEPPDLDEMTRRYRAIAAQGLPYLVAEIDGGFAGYACASGYRARAGYRWTVEDTVYVHPRSRTRGVGSALLARLIDDCAALGCRQMIAVIGDAENHASIALHARHGFHRAGTFEGIGYKHGRWLDNVQMLRPLGAGRTCPPSGST